MGRDMTAPLAASVLSALTPILESSTTALRVELGGASPWGRAEPRPESVEMAAGGRSLAQLTRRSPDR